LKEVCGTANLPVNTLMWSSGGMERLNTDAPALIEALQERTSLSGARVLLLGAGAVGAGVLRAMLDVGADVSVCNRTHERALELVYRIGGSAIIPQALHHQNRFDIVVNATSAHFAPSFPRSLSILPLKEWGVCVAAEFALDTTPFLNGAEKFGVRTVRGEELWVRQAAKQVHWWCGIDEGQLFIKLMEITSEARDFHQFMASFRSC
jgi:shikimate 5-dehydrogenase